MSKENEILVGMIRGMVREEIDVLRQEFDSKLKALMAELHVYVDEAADHIIKSFDVAYTQEALRYARHEADIARLKLHTGVIWGHSGLYRGHKNC